MPRHKTAYRKARESHEKQVAKVRAELLSNAKSDPTLKANALKAAKKLK